MFPFLFWFLAAPNCSQWKKISVWKCCWPPPRSAMAVSGPAGLGAPAPMAGWLWGVLGAEGDFWHMEKLAESVRRSVDPPERGAGHRSSDAFLPAPVLFAEDIAMRTGLLFCGEHRHEAGERLQGHRWHAELAVPTCPCSGSLSPPQLAAEPRLAPACAVQRRPPTVHRLPSRHHPASPRRHPASPPGFWGTLCGGHDAAVGGVGRKRPLRCLNEVGFFSTPPSMLGRITVTQASVLAESS